MSFWDLVTNEEGVEKVDGVSLDFASRWLQNTASQGWFFFICIGIICLVAYFYMRYQDRGSRKSRILLTVVRASLILLLLFCLAEPVIRVSLTSAPKPLLWLVFDGTDSMNIEDDLSEEDKEALDNLFEEEEGTVASADQKTASRLDYVKAFVKNDDIKFLEKLSEKFRLRAYEFSRSDGVHALETSESLVGDVDGKYLADQLTSTGEVTAIGAAFEDLKNRHASDSLAGVVVFSDFDQNSGPSPQAAANALEVPVYTIGIGPDAAMDIAVDIQAPLLLKKDERTTITVTLRQNGLESETVQVNLLARKTGGAASFGEEESDGEIIATKSVDLVSATEIVEFPYTPSRGSSPSYRIEA